MSMTDWKAIAKARGWNMPEEDLERNTPVLDSTTEALSRIAERLPLETEPANLYRVAPEDFE